MEILETYDIETKELLWAYNDGKTIWYFQSHEVQSFIDIRYGIFR